MYRAIRIKEWGAAQAGTNDGVGKRIVHEIVFVACHVYNERMDIKKSLIKYPSAWLPVALSLAVLAAMLGFIALFGAPYRELDEGTAAHLFQLWLLLEVVMITFFASKYLSQKPKQAL